MISAGNKIVADNAIEDPANYIAQKLAAGLASAHALNVVDAGGVQADGGDVKKLAALTVREGGSLPAPHRAS